MKKHEVRKMEGIVETLGHRLKDNPYDLHGLEALLLGCIELARTGKAWRATRIALEVSHFIADAHSRSINAERQKASVDSVKEQPGSSIGIGTATPAWSVPINIRTTQPSFTGYVGIRQDPPRPAATVEQMRAAADKAMMIEDNTYLCAGCGQKTMTDGEKPLGWHFNAEVHGGVYRALCGTCFAQGPFDEWECDACGKTSFPMRSMPTGWMEQQVRRGDDDVVMETVCDECAMGGES
jgi:hypothetical protein